MNRNELFDLAGTLDFASGFHELTNEESWDAEEILGASKYLMHRAAMDLYFAASLLLESPQG